MNGEKILRVGIDIGSTTAKIVVVDEGEVVYRKYERHYSQVRQKTLELLQGAKEYLGNNQLKIAISGSAGMGLAQAAGLPFVQEVFATYALVKKEVPDTDVVIELGGEDAKIIFLNGGIDERMNGSCAGGTGAFIDQMATLLSVTPDELDEMSLSCSKVYPIASRCGVFAKTDIQPLINQGVSKNDIAASIYHAVVNQTVAGLAQGRKIAGKVMFLGGPLYYNLGLRKSFVETLKLSEENAIFPEYALYSVALGASVYAEEQKETYTYHDAEAKILSTVAEKGSVQCMPPLFTDEAAFCEFKKRHDAEDVTYVSPTGERQNAYLGIDCGSTTTKLVLINEDKEILWSFYDSNKGNPVDVVFEQLLKLEEFCGDNIKIMGSAVTGYGEELMKNAFHLDCGIVETMAHFTAAKHFCPDVDFILDIGGQDIKCIRIKNDAVDSIMLNEACSSGCGSFIETFAKSMGYEVPAFAELGLKAQTPVDLGSRCTVFMNSSIKQAQKDGVSVENISAGISASVIKNAIYKVIRANSPKELGKSIVVQGGTFLNDAVLRSFENELGQAVVRPKIAGLMGAYGAALYIQSKKLTQTSMLQGAALHDFTHESKAMVCQGCTNHCNLTVNSFGDGGKFISGNRCERMKSGGKTSDDLNIYRYKRDRILTYSKDIGAKETIGLPLALGIYELAPLWSGILTKLGFNVKLSGLSSKEIYLSGQDSIPSDTVCYPAKIMHGHIIQLKDAGVDMIFAPCLTYNINEGKGDNHYNCPIVAYYPELLNDNMEELKDIPFLQPYLSIHDQKELARELIVYFGTLGRKFSQKEVAAAVRFGFEEYEAYREDIKSTGLAIVRKAEEKNRRIMILAGRPYHIDPEIGHGIDLLSETLGFAVISEDCVCDEVSTQEVAVLNQWTYHTRLYNSAKYATLHPNVELVQLVSFGCGIDAITTDEVRSILERSGKMYTQIKIDEITNLSAVNIRLRSLLGAMEMREQK